MYLKVGAKRMFSRLFLVVPSSRTRGNRQRLMHRSSTWTWGRNSLWVTMHWNRLSRKVVESPSLEILKIHLDTILCHVLWDDPAWVWRLEQMTHCDPFQPDPFCDSIICVLQLKGSCLKWRHWISEVKHGGPHSHGTSLWLNCFEYNLNQDWLASSKAYKDLLNP